MKVGPEGLPEKPNRKDVLRIEFFPPDLRRQLKIEAAMRNITMRELIIAMLRRGLATGDLPEVRRR